VRVDDGRKVSRRRLGLESSPANVKVLGEYRVFMERKGLAVGSVQKMLDVLTCFAEQLCPRDLLDASTADVELFVDRRKLGARARYHYISTIHGLFEWAVIYGHTTTDVTLRVVRPRFPRSIPRPIADVDLRQLIDGAPTAELRAMIALAAFHGLRAAEIAGMQREDILDRNVPAVVIVAHGKGGHQRVVPLHADGWEMIRPVTHGVHGWLFCKPSGGPLQPWAVSHALNVLAHDMGIESTCHSLRHWYGTKVYGASKDLRVTQALMGHASPNTTVGYVAFSAHDAHEAVSAIGMPS
jgi:site-specific recombinase XerD